MSDVDRFLDAEAEKQAELDGIVEDKQQALKDRIYQLLTEPEERDEELFERAGTDTDLVIADFESTPVVNRDINWQIAFASLSAASRMQAYAEIILPDILEASGSHGQKIQKIATKMDNGELKSAAKQGIGKGRIKGASERRRTISVSR